MAATLKSISQKAGVSVATVSRVLNKSAGSIKIGAGTRDRVLAIARELDYVPNRMAQAMRTQRTNNIGVLFSRDLTVAVTADIFYMQILSRIEEILLDRGYNIVLSSVTDQDIKQRRLPQIVVQKMVDALVVLRVSDAEYLAQLRQTCPATLLLDHCSTVVDSVASDNHGGMCQAVEHLIALGHERIGYVDSVNSHVDSSFRDRLAGYRHAMAQHDLEVEDRWIVQADPARDGGYDAIAKLREQAPELTAVACANDNLAIHALRFCQQHDVVVPGTLSIVGFDDVETSKHMSPALTTVAVDKHALGEHAIKILFDRMEADSGVGNAAVHDMVAVNLVVRDSSSSLCSPI